MNDRSDRGAPAQSGDKGERLELARRLDHIANKFLGLTSDIQAARDAAAFLRRIPDAAYASLDKDESQTVLEILDEIAIDRKIGADHQFSDEWWLVIEKCLRSASSVSSTSRGTGA